MEKMFKIAEIMLASLGSLFFNPLFWVVTGITAIVYNRSTKLEVTMLGYKRSLWKKVSNSILAGLLAGLLGSSISMFLGITIDQYVASEASFSSGIWYIWIIALLLSLINPRYLCFSYAGGIVALSNLLIGFPYINAIGILSLVGILHLCESLLIWIDGHSDATPVFLKLKSGKITGGYIMNRVWPLPMMILFSIFITNTMDGSIQMPEWWPIIRQAGISPDMDNIMFMIQPIPVVLGYGDMAITKTPRKRARDSALRLSIYSIILIALSVLASKTSIFAYLAALFSPLGHEFLILYSQREEERGEAIFDRRKKGLKILYSKEDSPAEKMGIEAGDIIARVNNIEIDDENVLKEILSMYPSYIWIDIIKEDGSLKTVEYKDYKNGINNLGTIIVPENPNFYFEINKESPFLGRLKTLLGIKNKKA